MKNTVRILSFLSVTLLVISFLTAAFLIDRSSEEKRAEKQSLERELETLRRSINMEKAKNAREAIDARLKDQKKEKLKKDQELLKRQKLEQFEREQNNR